MIEGVKFGDMNAGVLKNNNTRKKVAWGRGEQPPDTARGAAG
jgi:hypothetical protein